MKRYLKAALATAIVAIALIVGTGVVMADTPTPTPTATPTPTVTPSPTAEIHGTISALAATATPPTVSITPKSGPVVTVSTNASTVITKAGIGTTTIDKLAVGDRAEATYDKTTMVASKISVSPPLKDYASYVGTIKSIGASSLVVTTKKLGDVTVTVNADTKYKVPGVKDATLANFKAGDKVAVLSVASGSTNTAVHVVLVPGKPVFAARVGTVDAYVAGKSITVKGIKGETTTFEITASTKIRMERGVSSVAVGQRVIVTARRDPATDQYTATSIMVFGAKKGK